MSTLSLRLPDSLHRRAREMAQKDGVSVNQLVATALAEKLSALMTVEYLEERASRASRAKFDRVLSKVRDTAPEPADELLPSAGEPVAERAV
jgi:hypothetical protein